MSWKCTLLHWKNPGIRQQLYFWNPVPPTCSLDTGPFSAITPEIRGFPLQHNTGMRHSRGQVDGRWVSRIAALELVGCLAFTRTKKVEYLSPRSDGFAVARCSEIQLWFMTKEGVVDRMLIMISECHFLLQLSILLVSFSIVSSTYLFSFWAARLNAEHRLCLLSLLLLWPLSSFFIQVVVSWSVFFFVHLLDI